MKSLSYSLIILVAALLSSCSADEAEQEKGGRLPIVLSTDFSAVTRAQDGLNDDATITFPADFTVAVNDTNYSFKATSKGAAMTCTSELKPYFPLSGKSVRVQAYYPARNWGRSAESFTVLADQSSDDNYKASDLMYGLPKSDFAYIDGTGDDRKVKPTENAIPMEFQHKMAKIKVVVTTNGNDINSVTLNNIKRSISFNPKTGELGTATASGVTDVTLSGSVSGSTEQFTCTALVPPQTISKDNVFISATTATNTFFYNVPDDVTLSAGSSYILNLTTAKVRKKPGQVICSNGDICNYNDIGDRTAVGVVVYWDEDGKHGLALAMKDAANGATMVWSTRKINEDASCQASSKAPYEETDGSDFTTDYWNSDYYPAHKAAIENNGTPAPPGTSGWFLPSMYQWVMAVESMEGSETREQMLNLEKFFGSRGGTNINGEYWSANQVIGNKYSACSIYLKDSPTYFTNLKDVKHKVRAMLKF